MTTIAIVPVPSDEGAISYCAVAGTRRAVAKTAGQALDAIAAKLSPEENGTLIVVQTRGADRFFTAHQQERLQELMQCWRTARDAGSSLSTEDQAELEALIDAELRGAAERAGAIADELRP